jgi:hypothetical protein
MTDNWKENATKMVWTHKSNPHLKVMIVPNHGVKPLTKYIVVHYHPGTEGIVVPQPFEHTSSMAYARKLVRVHLKHWNDPKKWRSDPDFGKRGK